MTMANFVSNPLRGLENVQEPKSSDYDEVVPTSFNPQLSVNPAYQAVEPMTLDEGNDHVYEPLPDARTPLPTEEETNA